MKKNLLLIVMLLILSACSKSEEKTTAQLDDILANVYTYELNQVEAEHSQQVNDWMTKATQTGEMGQYHIHSFNNDTDEYVYTYVYGRGYSDYEVSFVYNPDDPVSQGSIHVTGLKNNSGSDSFVQIRLINDLSISFIMSDETIGERMK